MRLQSQVHNRYKGKEYRKFWVVIPKETVEKLAWVEGEELAAKVKGRTLIMRPLETRGTR